MKNTTLKFEDFATEKLSKNQQKTVRGGDGATPPPPPPVDPNKGGSGTGNG